MKRIQSFEEYSQYVSKLIEHKDDYDVGEYRKQFQRAVKSVGEQIYKSLKEFCLKSNLRLKDRRGQVPYQFYQNDGFMCMLWYNGNGTFYRLTFHCDLQDIIAGRCKLERETYQSDSSVYNHYKVIPMTIGEQTFQNL